MTDHDIRLIEIGQKEGYDRAVKDVVDWLRVQQHGRTSDNHPGYFARQIEAKFGGRAP